MVQRMKLYNILLRPQVDLVGLSAQVPELGAFVAGFDREILDLAETGIKYEGYIRKEEEMVMKVSRLEELALGEGIDYHSLTALSMEARDKLHRARPRTIGQASRISGVNPADVSVLLVHLGR
jgi:tRNA uridine 5-carboxymethylaminomethyl modification enzyme